uniref:SET domain-containing protein n=2 Tax=Alexandrium monilatum TaxID=311494 RepID=A0A7S4PTX5_9DINO
MENLLQVWIYNSFDQGSEGGSEAGAMYLAASMLSHSCSPNAAWHMDEANSFILHARKPIREGEEVTIPYLSPADLCLPTGDRREILSTSKAFWCGCERCVAPRDSTRSFRCPRCAVGSALVAASESGREAVGAGGGGDAPDAERLVCSSCGALSDAEATALLAAEAALRPWAREQAAHEGATKGPDSRLPGSDTDAAEGALERLRSAEAAGLDDKHWIVDVARGAAATEQPAMACELLRQRISAQGHVGAHAATKRARLHHALGEALCVLGDTESLQEAVAAYNVAAESLALLFGDDHPEHREAATLRDLTAKKLAHKQRAETGRPLGSGSDPASHAGGKRAALARKRGR